MLSSVQEKKSEEVPMIKCPQLASPESQTALVHQVVDTGCVSSHQNVHQLGTPPDQGKELMRVLEA